MFERNRIETTEQGGVAVEITTDSGECFAGQLLVGRGRNFVQALNGEGDFIEFESWGGDRSYVSKRALRSVKLVQAARPESLKGRISAMDGFDPHTILGLRIGAGLDEAKAAWHRLAKAYHPDRYATAELPEEVTVYLAAMARRINAAYAALETTFAPRKSVPPQRAPAYEPRNA
ncbi:MAG: DnaJ family molecular chaperone [Hyphomicrobiaceae bacterium]